VDGGVGAGLPCLPFHDGLGEVDGGAARVHEVAR
jgi:hypothetical protein